MLTGSAIASLTLLAGASAVEISAEASPSRSPSPPLARVAEATEATPQPGAATQPTLPVRVAIDPLDPGRSVSQRFLGLSFEAAALGQLSQYADRGNLVELLRSLGPGVLRFGGITADENVAWTDAATPRPAWASSVIGPA